MIHVDDNVLMYKKAARQFLEGKETWGFIWVHARWATANPSDCDANVEAAQAQMSRTISREDKTALCCSQSGRFLTSEATLPNTD